jgi:hypothetical protein
MADELTAELIPDLVAVLLASVPGAAVDPAPANTGNGTVTGIAGKVGAPVEVITLTCIAVAANGGTFNVVGSVSGKIGEALVGVAFVSSVINFTINDGAVDFILGDNFTITVANGANYTAKFSGNPNSQALMRASKWSIYSAVAPGTVINISPNDDGSGMVASGIVTTAAVTHVSDPPACKSVELAGIAAAGVPPARFLVRHGI